MKRFFTCVFIAAAVTGLMTGCELEKTAASVKAFNEAVARSISDKKPVSEGDAENSEVLTEPSEIKAEEAKNTKTSESKNDVIADKDRNVQEQKTVISIEPDQATEELYNAFIDNQIWAYYQGTEGHTFAEVPELEDGGYYSLEEILRILVQDTYEPGVKSRIKNLRYRYIDCGFDGIAEVLIEVCFEVDENTFVDYNMIFRKRDEKNVELCYIDTYMEPADGTGRHTIDTRGFVTDYIGKDTVDEWDYHRIDADGLLSSVYSLYEYHGADDLCDAEGVWYSYKGIDEELEKYEVRAASFSGDLQSAMTSCTKSDEKGMARDAEEVPYVNRNGGSFKTVTNEELDKMIHYVRVYAGMIDSSEKEKYIYHDLAPANYKYE